MKEPKVRFPGFTGEWVEKKLGEVTKSIRTGRLDANAMVEGGQYRFYTCAKNYSYIDSYAFEGDCIMIAGNGAHLGYVHHYNGKFNAYQRTYVLSDFTCDSIFLEYCIRHFLPNRIVLEKKEGNMPYIVLSTLTDMVIPLSPTLAEQQKIAECLTAIDDLIVAQSKKVDALKEHKKGLVQQLFPQPGETTPRLRFPGFTDKWVEKKLGEVFTRLTDRNIEDNRNVLTISAQFGLINQRDFFKKSIASADVTGYYLLQKGDFAYNKSTSQGKPVGAIKPLKFYDKGVVSTLYICFRCNDSREIDFWEQYFDAGILDKEIMSIAQEGARNHGLLNVPTNAFFELNLISPSLAEQQKIAECLSTLDDQIKAETAELDALKEHKKGLMQQLFP